MTTHHYDLNPHPFKLIKEGKKIYELRLYDEKRRQLKIGDIIEFTNNESGHKISVKIDSLHIFNTFKELYDYFPATNFGYEEGEKASHLDMLEYYSLLRQENNQVVAIKIHLF